MTKQEFIEQAVLRLITEQSLTCNEVVNRAKEVASLMYEDEAVSEDLQKAAEQDVCEVVNCCSATRIPNDHIPSWVQDAMVNEFIHGANWKKEQIMVNTADAVIGLPYENKDGGYTHLIDVSRPLPVGTNKIAIIFK